MWLLVYLFPGVAVSELESHDGFLLFSSFSSMVSSFSIDDDDDDDVGGLGKLDGSGFSLKWSSPKISVKDGDSSILGIWFHERDSSSVGFSGNGFSKMCWRLPQAAMAFFGSLVICRIFERLKRKKKSEEFLMVELEREKERERESARRKHEIRMG